MRRLCLALALSLVGALLVPPGAATADGVISSFSVSPDSVRDGASSQGTVTLAFPEGTDTTVLIFSGDTAVATVPATATIPAGAIGVTFPIATNAAAPPTIVQLTAWVGNTPRSANLSVNAATPPGPSLSSVSFVPTTIVGGQNATGTVRFTGAMTQGAVVQLSTGNPAIAQVPAETVVSAGQSSGTFNLSTSAVTAPTTITVTARWFSVTRTATVTVTPGTPPPADTVRITRATWKSGLLRIEATSTNVNAILSVYSSAGNFMFTLTNNGGGRYSDQRGFITNPQQIAVRSNFGGSAGATIKT
ncbi:hypothetical protein F4553_006177 [Allocatelliglobosispora scoriae]|uniref:Uncharacterized protein n=1 Tax=Allocatelliglobosispora scoriae TaxID=643052 RepID=A0A841C0R6_9ACTN|nr:hypothetical protein [Allocatelliglobosispora scoriae]MBB5872743.1 hypothetical protein [Allocatelliglobosispora scoriae]